jgi:hypothetical protein
MDIEKPAADAQEQERDLVEEDDSEEVRPEPGQLPFDANEADAAEQSIAVDDDDEDHR